MKVRRFRGSVHLTVIAALTLSGLLVTFAPTTVEAATFTTVPTRLYMAPAGVSIPNGIAQLVGVKVGTLEFDASTDPISQDVRSIVVNTLTGAAGCDLTVAPYDIDDCSRVQIGVSHGRLKAGTITTIDDGDGNPATNGVGDDVYLLPSGARIDNPYQVAKGSYILGINGTPEDLNQALADLVYTPDLGYYYEGSNDENLSIALIPGNGDDNLPPADTTDDTAYATIQIRVLNVNQFPVVIGPGNKQAQAGVELLIPAVAPGTQPPFTGTTFTVTDPDNDENVDGAQANPPVAEGALQDGAGSKMLLVGYLDCGVPTTDLANGFHFRGGTFEVNNNDIRSIVRDFFQFTQLPSSGQTIINTLLDGIDAIKPGLTTTMLATNSPTTYTSLFAGVGSMLDVQYALSQISFLQPAAADTCTLWTAVSDLGNNGLPLQYVGDPPTGIEVPMIGLGLDSFDINTGDLDEIDISFVNAGPTFVNESAAPAPVVGALRISPAVHPEFTIQWEVNPKSGDPEVAGIATAGDDFSGTYNNTLTIPENEEFIPISGEVFPDPPNTTVFQDGAIEGNETFTFDLVLNQTPPPGYFITSAVPSKTVVIVDDEDGDRSISVNDPAVVEGDSGTRSLNFTLTLSGPADGNETVQVSTADGSATVGDNDYEAVTAQVVTFAAGETSKAVSVTVNGDLVDELGNTDETLTLSLSNPSAVSISDATGVGTIENDDQLRTVSINDATTVEGNAGTSLLNFTLALSSPAKGNETVTVDSSDLTATLGDNDYEILTAVPVAFLAGATTASVSVTINGDNTAEANETFQLALGSNNNVVIGDGTATGTITNDDGVPTVTIGDVTVTEGNAGTTNAVFTITLSVAAAQPASVSVVSSNVTATAGTDYLTFGPQTVNFAIGDTSKTVTVIVSGDTEVEVTETFAMTLSAPDQLVIGDGSAVGTITNDDTTSSVVSIADATVTEGGAVDQAVISMTNPGGRTCVVTLTSVNGTAVAPGDFAVVTGNFNLVSVASDVLSLTIVDDPLVEVNETFTINIALHASSNPACVLGDGQATITIVSNDLASVVSIADATVTEAAAVDQTTISMTNPAGHNCVVTVSSINGTAVAPGDYAAVTGNFNLLAVPSDVLSLAIVDDPDAELGETFTVNIALHASSNPACVLGDSSAAILIVDNDTPPDATVPTVTINQAVGQADPTNTSPVLFTATFSEPVIGFGAEVGDVVLSGTSNGTKVATVTGGPTIFTVSVAVTGASAAGTVIATIPAAAASDGTNASLASTSTDNSVLFDVVAAPGPLTITVPANIIRNNDPGLAGATVTYPAVTTTGGVAPIVVACDRASGSFFVLGITTVSCTATDADGQMQGAAVVSGSFTVQVIDVEPPVIADLPDLTRVVPGLGSAAVFFLNPTATDNSGVPPTVVCSRVSGSLFSIGSATVTCTASDGAGNQASSSFTVTVTSDGLGLGLPATGSAPQPILSLALLLLGVGLLLVGQRRSRRRMP